IKILLLFALAAHINNSASGKSPDSKISEDLIYGATKKGTGETRSQTCSKSSRQNRGCGSCSRRGGIKSRRKSRAGSQRTGCKSGCCTRESTSRESQSKHTGNQTRQCNGDG